MAHLLQSKPQHPYLPIFWNVSAVVGVGGTNASEDVYLVQYMMKNCGKSSTAITNVALRNKLKVINVNGICDAYTIECIKAFQTTMKQQTPGTVVDGRVTKAPASLSYGEGTYTIVTLNFSYRRGYWGNWPCIEMDGDCPAVSNVVYRELYGTVIP